MKNQDIGKNIKSENPEKHTGLKLEKSKDTAAGIPALLSSAKHILSEMDPIRASKVLFNLNQKGGIDCPGCAWPDPDDDRSKLGEYCENGAKAIAEEATSKKLDSNFFAKYSIQQLSELSDYEIGKKGRIAQPMFLARGARHYTEISWEDAFEKISQELNTLNSPDEAIFYTSGRTSNEAAFLYQLFVREFGTNNLPDCSNMCHESSGVALSETLGIGKGSVKLEDFYQTDLIVIMGQNPGTNHPRMLSALEKAKENGATIITINPIIEAGLLNFSNPQKLSSIIGSKTQLSDHYLQVKINGDLALLQILNKLLLEKEKSNKGSVFDLNFIYQNTKGYENYIHHLEQIDIDPLIKNCGIPRDKLEEVAEIIAQKEKMIVCWAMGLTQHKNSVDTIKEIVNLFLLKGSIAKAGAGTCPVRGHSNVQGDRTMGIYEKPSQTFLDSLKSHYGFEPPRASGYNTVDSIVAMNEGRAKVFFAMGGNFLSATPDTKYTAEALQNCNLTVQVSTKLNRSHLVTGKEAIILPCLSRTDRDFMNGENQFQSVENSMGVVHSTRGSLKPISDKLKSEPEIVCQLAKASLRSSKVEWDKYLNHYDNIRNDIEACIPGFENYNKRVRQAAGFYLPNCARDNSYKTSSGKAEFTISTCEPIHLDEEEFLMMTIRSHEQFNTTIYGLDDRYRGIYNERRVVLMNEEDMLRMNFSSKDIVDLSNTSNGAVREAKRFIVVPYNIPSKCIATYFPETNVLVPIKSVARKSHTPTSKSVVVKIKKSSI